MKIEVDGVTRDATPEEEAAFLSSVQPVNQFWQQIEADTGLRKSQIKNFYDACVNGTATIGQMRTAWKVLLEMSYKDYIS